MPKNHTTVEVAVIPDCDYCGSPAHVDGRTRHSTQWANMCPRHWRSEGIGRLGLGYGQRYVLRAEPLTDRPFADLLDQISTD